MNPRIFIAAVVISLVCLGLIALLLRGVLDPESTSSPWETPAAESELTSSSEDVVDPIDIDPPQPIPPRAETPFEEASEVDPEISEALGPDDPALEATDDTGVVEIQVIDPGGEPKTDVVLHIVSARTSKEVTSARVDNEGRASLSLRPDSYWTTVDWAGDDEQLAGTRETFNVNEGETTKLELVLGSLDKSIAGRVLDTDGRGVEGIGISARPFRPTSNELVLVRRPGENVLTDENGNFLIEGLSEGEFVLQTLKDHDYGSERLRVLVPAADIQLVIYRQQRLVVTGTVTDSDTGDPLSGVLVASSLGGMIEKSAADGTFTLETSWRESPRAGLAITARKVGFLNGEKLILARDAKRIEHEDDDEFHFEAEVSFELQIIDEGATVLGTLVDEEGAPVPRERVFLHSRSRDVRYSATSSMLGAFMIKNVGVADDYRAWIYPRQSFKDFKLDPLSIQKGENELDITLEHIDTGTLGGVLVKINGDAMPFFSFRVRSMESLANHRSVTTDDEGRFRIEDVPAGSLLLETHARPKVTVRGIELEPNAELELEIPVGFGDQTLAGTVEASDGEAMSGARVVVTWIHDKDGLRTQLQNETATDAEGRFSVHGLAVGEARILVNVPGYQSQSTKTTLGSDAAESVEIQLKPSK